MTTETIQDDRAKDVPLKTGKERAMEVLVMGSLIVGLLYIPVAFYFVADQNGHTEQAEVSIPE